MVEAAGIEPAALVGEMAKSVTRPGIKEQNYPNGAHDEINTGLREAMERRESEQPSRRVTQAKGTR